MEDDLRRLESWLVEHGTSLRLAGPASGEAIAAAEARLGFALPADYRAFLALHDGQLAEEVSWLPGGGHLHAITDCVKEWVHQQDFVEADGALTLAEDERRFHECVFHPRRLCIGGSADWDGDNLVLDMLPGPEGREGQLLGFVTECDFVLLGDGFAGFLARYVALIDAGALLCVPVADQNHAFEVVPADWKERNHYESRWDGLLDPRRPLKKARKKK
jgi:cell wall assembly regulator SMI1